MHEVFSSPDSLNEQFPPLAVCAVGDYPSDVLVKLMNAFKEKFCNIHGKSVIQNASTDSVCRAVPLVASTVVLTFLFSTAQHEVQASNQ